MLGSLEWDAPAQFLPRFIEAVRPITATVSQSGRFAWLPDGRTGLVFRVLDGGAQGDVAILGPRTRVLFKRPPPLARGVVVQFKPGWAAALFGVPAGALADRVVPLEEVWGRQGRELGADLIEAGSLVEMLERITRAFMLRAGGTEESSSARLARRAARLFEKDMERVEDVAAALGVTARHLRRAFGETIGVRPKAFSRGLRLKRALGLAASSRDWARIATGAGYCDQSHLIADFRELTGSTPAAVLEGALESVHLTDRKSRWQDRTPSARRSSRTPKSGGSGSLACDSPGVRAAPFVLEERDGPDEGAGRELPGGVLGL